MQKQRGWLSFGISGLDGMLYRTDNTVERISNTDWFQSARKGKYVITEPAQSSSDRRYIFIVAIPVRDLQGKITGVINATVLGDALSNLISDIIVGETGTAYLVSSSGTILGNRRPEILYKSIYSEIIGSGQCIGNKRNAVYIRRCFDEVCGLDAPFNGARVGVYGGERFKSDKNIYYYRIDSACSCHSAWVLYCTEYYPPDQSRYRGT